MEYPRLFTLDPEAHLFEVIARMPDDAIARSAESFPAAWLKVRASASAVA